MHLVLPSRRRRLQAWGGARVRDGLVLKGRASMAAPLQAERQTQRQPLQAILPPPSCLCFGPYPCLPSLPVQGS